MRTLILLRHGEAQPAGGRPDIERRLTPKGERDAAAAGRRLADLGFEPDVALVSPAARTQETWAAAARALGEVPMRLERGLLHVEADAVLGIGEAAGAERVMVVGHNPGLAALVDRLARASDASEARVSLTKVGFPPASAAVFSQADGAWRFDAFLPPEGSA